MVAYDGRLVLLKVGNGGTPETFTTIGGLLTTRLSVNNRAIDASHRESGAWRILLAGTGIRSFTIAGSGRFNDSASEELVRGYAFSGSTNQYQLQFPNGDIVSGAFLVQGYERKGNMGSEEQYAITLESAGAIGFTAG